MKFFIIIIKDHHHHTFIIIKILMIAAQSDWRVQRHIGSGEGNSSPHGTHAGDKHDENDVVCEEDDVYDGHNTVVKFYGASLNQFHIPHTTYTYTYIHIAIGHLEH